MQLMQPGWELQPKPWELPPARVSLLWTVSNRSCPPAAGNPAPLGGGSTALTRIWVIAFQHFGFGAKIEVNHTRPGAIMREACKGAGGKIWCCGAPGGSCTPFPALLPAPGPVLWKSSPAPQGAVGMEPGRCPWPWGSAEPLGTPCCGVWVWGCFCSPAGPQAELPAPCPRAMELGGRLQVHRFMPEMFKCAALCNLQGPSKTISPQRCLAICMSAALTHLHFAGCLLQKILQVLTSRY